MKVEWKTVKEHMPDKLQRIWIKSGFNARQCGFITDFKDGLRFVHWPDAVGSEEAKSYCNVFTFKVTNDMEWIEDIL